MIRYSIAGLATNVNFLMDLAALPEFVAGNVDTEFIPRHYDQVPYRTTVLAVRYSCTVDTVFRGHIFNSGLTVTRSQIGDLRNRRNINRG
jgi:acetyl/propionyl-CoA carboxylase alpha subunit